MSLLKVLSCVFAFFLLAGCTSMKIEDFENKSPSFVLEDYFLGTVKATGFLEGRSGDLKRYFTVTIKGVMEDGRLVLTEDFLFDDGEVSQRIWRVKNLGNGKYEGTADDVVGIARGESAGNALRWRYLLDQKLEGDDSIRLRFDDWMYLMPDDILLNRATITKFGFKVGTVFLSFRKVPDEELAEGKQ